MRRREVDARAARRDVHTTRTKHSLGVITRRRGLVECHAHTANDAGEENRAFHLRTRNLTSPGCVFERSAVHGHRQAAVFG